MLNFIFRNYWRIGFQTRLYDLMSPQAYFDSIEASVRCLDIDSGERVLDAGCGSGLTLGFIRDFLAQEGTRYVGVDVLLSGLQAAAEKSRETGVSKRTCFFQADLRQPLPLQPESFARVLSHFCIYTLGKRENRLAAWRSLYEATRPHGILVAANPSTTYDPRAITEASLDKVLREKGPGAAGRARLVYCFTRALGLNHIKRQLDAGAWHAYSLEDFKQELREAGWVPVHHESVYGNSGWLLKCKKL